MPEIKGLYAIVDTTLSPRYSHVELAYLILLGGCKILQLRAKDPNAKGLWSNNVFDVAYKILEFKKKFEFTFIINDYVDVAGEVGADGVHVGPNDTSVAEARQRLGNDFIIGYSSSSGIDLGMAAERHGADYIAFGAIFPTKAKGPNHPVQGIARLEDICRKIKKPVVAIGGINRANIDSVIRSGVSSIAMIRGITEAKDIVSETRWYVEKCQQF